MRYKFLALPLIALSLAFSGCATNQAQIGVQTALTAMADGVNSTGSLLAQEIPAVSAVAREDLAMRVRVGRLSPGEAMSVYIIIMDRWNGFLVRLEIAREVLLVGQRAFDIWVDTGELPGSWGAFCADIEGALTDVLSLAETCGFDPPSELVVASQYASEVCLLAADWFSPNN